jgi:hypothetical protein
MPFGYLGRMLISAGVLLVVIGGIVLLAGRAGLSLGRLPGDVTYRGSRFVVFAPLGTSLLLSLLFSLVLYIISLFRR